MKYINRVSTVLVVSILFLSMLVLTANAMDLEGYYFNSHIIKQSSPKIDGMISSNDGWGGYDINQMKNNTYTEWGLKYAKLMEGKSLKGMDYFFSYDKEGLYFAAEITFESGQYGQTAGDFDTIDYTNTDDEEFAFDGDVFVLALDPMGWFYKNGYKDSRTAWYCVSNDYPNGTAVYRKNCREGLVDNVKAEWKRNSGDYRSDSWLEMFIPWSEIAEDCKALSGGDFSPTVEQLYDFSRGQYEDVITDPENTWLKYQIIFADRYYNRYTKKVETKQVYSLLSYFAEDHPTRKKLEPYDPLYSGDYYDELYNPVVKNYLAVCLSNLNDYSDIKLSDFYKDCWYKDALEYVVSRNIMSGISKTEISPNGSMTRAMMVSVLRRMSGDEGIVTDDFSDVVKGSWYEDSVGWAVKNGITAGIGGGRFAPGREITREEAITLLKKYDEYIVKRDSIDNAEKTEPVEKTEFADADKVSAFAKEAISWSVDEGIISGITQYGKPHIVPQKLISRAEAAQMIMKYCER